MNGNKKRDFLSLDIFDHLNLLQSIASPAPVFKRGLKIANQLATLWTIIVGEGPVDGENFHILCQ